MTTELTESIEQWFAIHDGDGEFVCGTRAMPYSVIGPTCDVRRLVLTTKPTTVSALLNGRSVPGEFCMIGRYGLPCKEDVNWIRKISPPTNVAFLGDMDAVDLLVFAWLRASLHPMEIVHLGINDALIEMLRVSSTECLSIPCSSHEQDASAFLSEAFPDLQQQVGANCAEVLKEGKKIEMDALVSTGESALSLLRTAVCSGSSGDSDSRSELDS